MLDNVVTEYRIINKSADDSYIPCESSTGKELGVKPLPSSNSAILLPKLRVSFQYRRPNQAFRISIIGSRENVTRGMLVDGEYTSYEILTCRIVIQPLKVMHHFLFHSLNAARVLVK